MSFPLDDNKEMKLLSFSVFLFLSTIHEISQCKRETYSFKRCV